MMNRSGSSKTCNKSRLNRKDKSHAETSTNRDGNGGRLNRKDKSTDDTPANRAGKYNYWIPRKTEILLNLVNVELKAKDYTIRLPDNPAKKRIEEKYYEMTGDKIIFEPEMRNRLDYMRRLRQHYNMLINRTGVRVNPTTEQIEMPSSWWDDRIAELRIAELLSVGIENMSDEELTELILLEEDEILHAYISPAMDYYCRFFYKEPMSQEKGKGWCIIRNQIYENEVSCRRLVRMSREGFTRLCELLKGRYGLQDTHSVCVDESVAIFLILCGQNDTQYDLGLRFGHAQETIGRKFHEVLGAMERMAVDYMRPRTIQEMEATSNRLEGDGRYWPFFSGFVGALDGTHVPVMVTPGKDSIRFISRKGTTSLNVLAMCDADMLFTYCFVGMAGSAHDARVLATAIRDDPMFPTPPEGKYYLVDSGYANSRGYLAPYRKQRNCGTRYHLQEFLNGEAPRNSKEMFNRWHASLRSVIERTFGVWKKKWRVLNEFPRYGISVQRRVIFATMGLHNFIRRSNIRDVEFEEAEAGNDVLHGNQNISDDTNDNQSVRNEDDTVAGVYMKAVRDQIAKDIWIAKHCTR